MSWWIRFVLAVLATWRVTHLLASEDGPADIIVRFRALLGPSIVGKLMDCFNCLSLWIAALAALFVSRQLLEWVFWWLALSGGALSARTNCTRAGRDSTHGAAGGRRYQQCVAARNARSCGTVRRRGRHGASLNAIPTIARPTPSGPSQQRRIRPPTRRLEVPGLRPRRQYQHSSLRLACAM